MRLNVCERSIWLEKLKEKACLNRNEPVLPENANKRQVVPELMPEGHEWIGRTDRISITPYKLAHRKHAAKERSIFFTSAEKAIKRRQFSLPTA